MLIIYILISILLNCLLIFVINYYFLIIFYPSYQKRSSWIVKKRIHIILQGKYYKRCISCGNNNNDKVTDYYVLRFIKLFLLFRDFARIINTFSRKIALFIWTFSFITSSVLQRSFYISFYAESPIDWIMYVISNKWHTISLHASLWR